MRVLPIVALGVTAAGTALAQTFEPVDFNVTEALLDNGIEPSILVDLENALGNPLSKRANPCSLACSTLKVVFGSSKLYTSDALHYWSILQDELVPTCTFKPTSALEVSTFVLLSRLTQCPFAVKGGGHANFAGASNIDGGITLSMERFKNVDVLPGGNIAAVGPGNRWIDVYSALEKHKLAVVGGRAASVGVPGLTLGGGVSHHINTRGFACDNIAAFEVVTSSGIIIKASPTSYSDLYWALRGGGGNFGIVTNFHFEAFHQGPMWGGNRRGISPDDIPRIEQAFVNTINNAAKDGKAAHYYAVTSAGIGGGQRVQVVSLDLQYSEPVSSPPEIFQEYLDIPYQADEIKEQSLVETTIYLNESQPDGFRQHFWAIPAVKVDLDMIRWIRSTFFNPDFTPTVGDITPVVSLTFQAISVPALERMKRNGGNPLGLDASMGPLFHCMLFYRWSGGVAEDEMVYTAVKKFEDLVVAEAKRRGLATTYTYMPYAGAYAKVVEGYGSANQKRLQSIAKKYDPTQVFQRLQPGGHKLQGSPQSP